jgi:hypothetical protein
MQVLKNVIVLIILLSTVSLHSTRHEVSLDGAHAYTSIQTAIDTATDNDTILVYPGRYLENLNFNGKDLSLLSMYAFSHNPQDIEDTFINGQPTASCIMMNNGEIAVIKGFKISNNYPYQHLSEWNAYGGGIHCYDNGTFTISDCIITDCIGVSGGAIYAGNDCNLEFSNVQIYNNQAYFNGGGLVLFSSYIQWDSTNRCSVYGNYSSVAMDMLINACNQDNNYEMDIYFNMLSSPISEPDYYYVREMDMNRVSLEVNQGFLNFINQDIYVSPSGNDANNGISSQEPLKSIAYAMSIAEPDSLNPINIYLAPGTYSYSQNQQIFPFSGKSFTNLIGSDVGNSIIDIEGSGVLTAYFIKQDFSVTNISIENGLTSGNAGTIGILYCHNASFSNLSFSNCVTSRTSGIDANTCHDITIENVIVRNALLDDDEMDGFYFSDSDVILNNVIVNNIRSTDIDSDSAGMYMHGGDVSINNSAIMNCYSGGGSVMTYFNNTPDQSKTLRLTNSLIANNGCGTGIWWPTLIWISNVTETCFITNTTIANNYNPSKIAEIWTNTVVSNSIMYNPETDTEISFGYSPNVDNPTLDIDYCCIEDGRFGVYASNNNTLIYGENNMQYDPMFIGESDDALTPDMPVYYRLAENSLCINAGTPDTTGLQIKPYDLDGAPRIWDSIIDIGCYEYNSLPVADDTQPEILEEIRLYNYPNPVYLSETSPHTFIEFTLPKRPVKSPEVTIYNIKGQVVRTLTAGISMQDLAEKAGLQTRKSSKGHTYSLTWNCRDARNKKVSSGVYFYKLKTGTLILTNKMLLLK